VSVPEVVWSKGGFTMLPDPLHPALVHFPIVFMILLPIAAGFALWSIRRGTTPRKIWALPVGLAAALSLSAWLSAQTGEAQEDRVERVVSEQALETHEEAADRFLLLSIGVLAISAVGLARGRLGAGARVAGAVSALGLVAAGAQVGHSGGALVYRHGAASAYSSTAAGVGRVSGDSESEREARRSDDDGDEDEDDR
jgi:uncharacterized membrane protein